MATIYDLLKRLQQENLEFVLIGGLAAIFHGATFVTQDVDICMPFTRENLTQLLKAVDNLNPRFRMSPNRPALPATVDELAHFKNLYLVTDAGQLDILGMVDGIGDYHLVKQSSIEAVYNQLPLRILNIDGVIQSKLVLKRDRDKLVISELKHLKQKSGLYCQ